MGWDFYGGGRLFIRPIIYYFFETNLIFEDPIVFFFTRLFFHNVPSFLYLSLSFPSVLY